MLRLDAFVQYREAVAQLRDEQPTEALLSIRRAVDLDPLNAYYLSYCGLILAHAEGRYAEAEDFCNRALRMERKQAQLYLNLADVYSLAGRRQDAADALSRGLRYAPRDYRLRTELSRLALRRPPVLPFLERRHVLNRSLGRMRHRALQLFNEAKPVPQY